MFEDTLGNISDTLGNIQSQFDAPPAPASELTELSNEQMKKRKTIRLIVGLVLLSVVIAIIIKRQIK